MEAPKVEECISRECNGFYFNGYYLARELVSEILIRLDCNSLEKCRLVCKQWNLLISDPIFWKHKLELEGRKWPAISLDHQLQWNAYACIYQKEPFGRNLLANPFGKDKLAHWNVVSQGGDGFAFEEPPVGSDEVPSEAALDKNDSVNSCFATSYHSCSKSQTISLRELRLPEEVLDKLKPEIRFTDWFAGRFDCGCVYECKFSLLNHKKEILKSFEFRQTIKQWEGREWQKVSHGFTGYPDGVSYLEFYHGGTDTQFWRGHYGAKLTGSSLIIKLE